MSLKKYKPSTTKQEFDACAAALRADLEDRFEASRTDAERPAPNPATKGAFEEVPELDSKTVACWSPTIKEHIGCHLDPRLIRKGGYESFEQFWEDIAPKLRESCPDVVTAPAEETHEVSQ